MNDERRPPISRISRIARWRGGRCSMRIHDEMATRNPGSMVDKCKTITRILSDSGGRTFLQRGSPPPPPWRLLPESLPPVTTGEERSNCYRTHEAPMDRRRKEGLARLAGALVLNAVLYFITIRLALWSGIEREFRL